MRPTSKSGDMAENSCDSDYPDWVYSTTSGYTDGMFDGDEEVLPVKTWSDDERVCADCFGDKPLKECVIQNVDSVSCSFCGRHSSSSIAAPLPPIVDHILSCVKRDYDSAVSTLPFDSHYGFRGKTWLGVELLRDEIQISFQHENQRLYNVLANSLGHVTLWCRRNPLQLRQDDALTYTWWLFCREVKHRRRYFFEGDDLSWTAKDPNVRTPAGGLRPADILRSVTQAIHDFGLVRTLDAGATFYRARAQTKGGVLTSGRDFGPPPVAFATNSNRMSPAGIVMFYGSTEVETASAEVAHLYGDAGFGGSISNAPRVSSCGFCTAPTTAALF